MGQPCYQILTARSAVNRVEGMPFRWSLNPYRGCTHGCQYCYARVTHGYFDLGMGRDFEQVIFVKQNLPELLRAELRRPSWRHEAIVIGTATDPYQPAEGTFRITRRCLEALADEANPCSVTTKGTLVVRDLDVLQQLSRDTTFGVHVSLITLDPVLWPLIEPGTPPPFSRLRALERLRAAGIPASVFLAPILPGLTDRPKHLEAVVRAAAEHGATGVWPGTLRLAPGVKEWFLGFLRRDFPELAASYERGYGHGANAPPAYRERVAQRVEAIKGQVAFQRAPVAATPSRVGRQFTFL
ncbi:MAG TPA: radical SAM protein [Chloroflexota bacterium]|nr:radical SAM protein [Chloroflexota bacterium]